MTMMDIDFYVGDFPDVWWIILCMTTLSKVNLQREFQTTDRGSHRFVFVIHRWNIIGMTKNFMWPQLVWNTGGPGVSSIKANGQSTLMQSGLWSTRPPHKSYIFDMWRERKCAKRKRDESDGFVWTFGYLLTGQLF